MRYWLFEMITNPMILYSVVNYFYLFSLFDSLFFKYRDISLTFIVVDLSACDDQSRIGTE